MPGHVYMCQTLHGMVVSNVGLGSTLALRSPNSRRSGVVAEAVWNHELDRHFKLHVFVSNEN